MTAEKTFGQAIREARLAKGMSMGQLAARVERSTASVRRWERDEGLPAETVVQRLVEALDLADDEYAPVRPKVPSVEVVPDTSANVSGATRATPQAASGATGTSPATAKLAGWFDRLRDPNRPWLGYIRAALTVVVLLVLGWLLIWALAGLAEAVGEIWESLWSGTP